MTLRLLAAASVTAASLALPAAPAFAVSVEPCPSGQIGVVLVDDNGELAEACVRRDALDLVLDRLGEARDRVVDCTTWFREHPLPTMYQTEHGIVIENDGGPDMYVLCLLTGSPG